MYCNIATLGKLCAFVGHKCLKTQTGSDVRTCAITDLTTRNLPVLAHAWRLYAFHSALLLRLMSVNERHHRAELYEKSLSTP
jgi:hypothetical protein